MLKALFSVFNKNACTLFLLINMHQIIPLFLTHNELRSHSISALMHYRLISPLVLHYIFIHATSLVEIKNVFYALPREIKIWFFITWNLTKWECMFITRMLMKLNLYFLIISSKRLCCYIAPKDSRIYEHGSMLSHRLQLFHSRI